MFWVVEETEPYLWRTDNIISCVMSCLQRLLYCVRYSMLMHYFICDNNLFNLRFNANNKSKMISVLQNLYDLGINCFALTETLQDYDIQASKITENIISVQQIMPIFSSYYSSRFKNLLFAFYIIQKRVYLKGYLL